MDPLLPLLISRVTEPATAAAIDNFREPSQTEKAVSADRLARFANVLQGDALHSSLKDNIEKVVVTGFSCQLRIANAICCSVNEKSLAEVFHVILCSRLTGATAEVDTTHIMGTAATLGTCSKEKQNKIREECYESLRQQSLDKSWNTTLLSETDAYGKDVCISIFTRDIWDYLEASDPSLRGKLPGRVFARFAKYGFCPMYEYLFIATRNRLELWVLGDDECASIHCNKPASLLCTGCRMVRYCSLECQQEAWKGHKSTCKKKNELGSAYSARFVKIRASVMQAINEDPTYSADHSRIKQKV
jgi:hypothetical protein